MRRVALSALALLVLTASSEPKREARWMTTDADGATASATLKQRDSLLFTRITPREAYRLESDVVGADGKVLLARGTPLIATRGAGRVACQITGKFNKLFTCLSDPGSDGSFDSYFQVVTFSDLFLHAVQPDRPSLSLPAPVRYAPLPPADAPKVDIKLYFNRKGGALTRDGFDMCLLGTSKLAPLGPDKIAKFCSSPSIEVGPSKLPLRLDIYGGTVTFLAKHDGAYDVEVTRPPAGTDF